MALLENNGFFDAAPVAMIITDEWGAIRFMNRQASALLGDSPNGSRASKLSDFIDISSLRVKGTAVELSFDEFMKIHSQNSKQWIISREGIKVYAEVKVQPYSQDSEVSYIWSLVPVEPTSNLAYDLNERVKEQLSIVNVTDAFFKSEDIKTALTLSLKAVQHGWQFPELTAVRVKLCNLEEFATEDFRQTPWRLTEDIITSNKYLGSLEVCYTDKVPEYEGSVFFPEEERLIKLLARLLGILIDHWGSDIKIRETESNLNAVFESATDGYLLTDKELNIRAFNARAKDQILEITNSHNLEAGRNIRDYLEPDRVNFFADAIRHVKNGEVVEYGRSHETPRGLRWTHYTIFPVKQESLVVGFCLVGRDDTEKVTAQNKLMMSERMYKTLVQEGSDRINIIDHECNYKHITHSINSVLAPKAKDFIGRNAFEFVHPEDRARLKQEFDALRDVKRVKSSPYRFNVGDNQYRWMETVATNLMDDPAIEGIVINSHDITNSIHHLHAIEYQNKVLQEISWMQSHQVRAPLSAILGLIDLITEDADGSKLRELVHLLKESALNLDTIVKETVRKTEMLEGRTKT